MIFNSPFYSGAANPHISLLDSSSTSSSVNSNDHHTTSPPVHTHAPLSLPNDDDHDDGYTRHMTHIVHKYVSNMVFHFVRDTYVGKMARLAYVVFVVFPVREIYVRFWWKNMPLHDICAHITSYQSAFWRVERDHCMRIIDNEIDAILVACSFVLYIYVWMLIVRCVFHRCIYNRTGHH